MPSDNEAGWKGLPVVDFEKACERAGEMNLFEQISNSDQRVSDFWNGEAIIIRLGDREFAVQLKVYERC